MRACAFVRACVRVCACDVCARALGQRVNTTDVAATATDQGVRSGLKILLEGNIKVRRG